MSHQKRPLNMKMQLCKRFHKQISIYGMANSVLKGTKMHSNYYSLSLIFYEIRLYFYNQNQIKNKVPLYDISKYKLLIHKSSSYMIFLNIN